MAKTTYLANKVVEHVTGKATFTKPTNTYLGLLTTNPTVAGDASGEVAGGGYARQQVSFGSAADRRIKNDADIVFPTMPSATVIYVALFDSLTAGNMLYFFRTSAPIIATVGQDLTIDTANLLILES